MTISFQIVSAPHDAAGNKSKLRGKAVAATGPAGVTVANAAARQNAIREMEAMGPP